MYFLKIPGFAINITSERDPTRLESEVCVLVLIYKYNVNRVSSSSLQLDRR